jgi:hypothetical protein
MDQFIQRNEIGDKITTSFIADDPTKAAEIFLKKFTSTNGVNDIVMFDYYVYNNLMYKPEKNNELNFVEIAFISTFSANIQKMAAWQSIYKNQDKFILEENLYTVHFCDLKYPKQLEELSEKIIECNKVDHVKSAICTKILYLKYPHTVPILDSYVQAYFGIYDVKKLIVRIHTDLCNLRNNEGGKYREFEDSFRKELNKLVQKDKRLGMRDVNISAIRIYDLLIWDFVNDGGLPGIWIEETLWNTIHKKNQHTIDKLKKSAGGIPINVLSEPYNEGIRSWNKRDVVIISSSLEYKFDGNVKQPNKIIINKEEVLSAETIGNKIKDVLANNHNIVRY